MIVMLTCTRNANGVCLGHGPNQSRFTHGTPGNNSKHVQIVSDVVSPQAHDTEVTELRQSLSHKPTLDVSEMWGNLHVVILSCLMWGTLFPECRLLHQLLSGKEIPRTKVRDRPLEAVVSLKPPGI